MTKTHLWPRNAARAVEDEYANHPLYQALRPIVLDFSTRAQQLSWSPSELFYHTLYTLDKLRCMAGGDERMDYCRSAWNEMYAYICERSDADDGERRLMATQLCVAVSDCLYAHNRLTWFKDIQTLNEAACVGYGKAPMELSYAFLPLVDENHNAHLKAWLTEYFSSEDFISDDIEELLAPHEEPLVEFSDKTMALFNNTVMARGISGIEMPHRVERREMLTALYRLTENWNCDGTRWKLLYMVLKEKKVLKAEYKAFVQHFVAVCNTVEDSDMQKIADRIRKNGLNEKMTADWTDELRQLKKVITEIVNKNLTKT